MPLPPLSKLGLGCVTFGREIAQPDSFALMDHAVASGLTFFDTAAAYGAGASETIVGEWLATRRPADAIPLIATKLLPPYTPEQMAASVDASRRRLHLDRLPLLFLHRWDDSALAPANLDALAGLIAAGKVGHLGISNVTRAQLVAFAAAADGRVPLTAIQNNNNFAVRDIDAAMAAHCAASGIAVVTYSPLGAGFLTGKHADGVEPGSRFAIVPGHQNVYFNPQSRGRLAVLQERAAKLGVKPALVAMAWAIHQPGVASVLVGGRTPAHLDVAREARELDGAALQAILADSI